MTSVHILHICTHLILYLQAHTHPVNNRICTTYIVKYHPLSLLSHFLLDYSEGKEQEDQHPDCQ